MVENISQMLGGYINNMYYTIAGWLSQLIVVMFFFYSGYGMMEQLKRRGDIYIKGFLKKRFLPTYISFVICVLFYLIMNNILKIQYPMKQILLSFTGWEGIGNSNWFMFVTFVLYILFFLSFRFIKKIDIGFVVFCFLSLIFFIILHELKDTWWWNTFLCLPIGMFWSLYKDKLEHTFFSNTLKWTIIFSLIFILFSLFYILSKTIAITYIATTILFSLLIVILSMKLSLKQGFVFYFLGKHVFSIYILQRIPFIIFEKIGLNSKWYIYLPLCFIVTLIIASFYDVLFEKLRYTITKKLNVTNNTEVKHE